jgi:(4S)-4-hydroxy-5-phosphonooxypentane-2,3-dione isomerase
MVVLLVQFTVRAGEERRARELMRAMEQHTRNEPGCVSYIGHQSTTDPRRFFFYETYQDDAALAAHRASPYFDQYVTRGLDPIVETRERGLFVPVGS